MSNNPETDLDLEKLFLPAWAQEPASTNRYAKYTGEEDRPERRRDERRGPRPPRREGPRREFGEGRRAERPRGPRREERGPRPPREDRGPRPPREERGGGRPQLPRQVRREREPMPPLPLPKLNATLVPEEKSVETLTRQIRMTGRAYPLFSIGQLILQKPDRCQVRVSVKKNAEGQPVQPLFACALDETLWLSEDEAVGHVLRRHFATFYQAERTATEPPKGKYTFVAQCGMSGVILGPPNHHDYQNQLRKLHAERFSRMPFEAFKSRIRIVRDEAVVKQWVDEQSWKTEYVCLNVPEPLKLSTRAEVEQHFRSVHKDTLIKPVDSFTLNGPASRSVPCSGLGRLIRQVWEDQKHFPLQLATVLSQQFASRGLQFFKVNRTVTHVSVARPHYLDLQATPVSDGVKRIVEFINANPKCSRRALIEALAPSPAQPPPPTVQAPAPTDAGGESPASAPAEGAPAASPAEVNQAPATEAAPATPPASEPTPEQTMVIADLHWLVHQGHVIEFANGALETAKKPLPRPPKPEPKPAETQPVEASAAAPSPVEAPAEAAAPAETQAGAPASDETALAPAVPAEAPATPAESAQEAPAATGTDSTPPVEPAPAPAEAPPESATETPAAAAPTPSAEPQT